MKTVSELTWRSIHIDYLHFAYSSYRRCKSGKKRIVTNAFLNKDIIDSIRYSYDCLEASVEFIYHMGRIKQLRIRIKDNWLTRNLKRKWNDFGLADKIGMLTFAWTNKSFWENPDQFQLFQDLKKVRDGLTHPIPFGTSIEKEIISERRLEGGKYSIRKNLSEEKDLKPDWLTLPNKSIAKFENNPLRLRFVDSEKALEILIKHLLRIEKIFFPLQPSWFAIFDDENNDIIPVSQLHKKIICRFDNEWSI